MRVILVAALAFGFSISSEAQVRSQTVQKCSFTTAIRGTNNQYGYACGSNPLNVQVADYYSTATQIEALIRRVQELESRVQALEGASQK